MSLNEWPKVWKSRDKYGKSWEREVAPADLTQELYNTLRQTRPIFDPESVIREKVDKAIARYEREVGK